jgi:hypothetical protein
MSETSKKATRLTCLVVFGVVYFGSLFYPQLHSGWVVAALFSLAAVYGMLAVGDRGYE